MEMRIGDPGLSIKAIPEYLTRSGEESSGTKGRQQGTGKRKRLWEVAGALEPEGPGGPEFHSDFPGMGVQFPEITKSQLAEHSFPGGFPCPMLLLNPKRLQRR